jgi:putative ATP-binding cassette transporter
MISLLRVLLRASWRSILTSGIASTLSGVATAAIVALTNRSLALRDGGLRGAPLLFFSLCIIAALNKVGASILIASVSQRVAERLRASFTKQIVDARLTDVDRIGGARLLAAFNEDVPVISQVCSELSVLTSNVGVVLATLVYVGYLSLGVLALLVSTILLGLLAFRATFVGALASFQRARRAQDEVQTLFSSAIGGVKELQLNRDRAHELLGALSTALANNRREAIKGTALILSGTSWGELLYLCLLGLVVFAQPTFLPLSPEMRTATVIAIMFLLNPLSMILLNTARFGRAAVALRHLEELRGRMPGAPTGGTRDPVRLRPTLQLSSIVHRYGHSEREEGFSLGPIDLTLPAAEIVFVTGGNGSGKSTLGKILSGLYFADQGEIRLDGLPITEGNWEWYRSHFSAVYYDFHLFDSLPPSIAPEQAAQAATYLEQLGLNDKVRIDAGKFSTLALSSGQRKRLALLCALLEDRPIYIFDEWASDQDAVFRKLFYLEILPSLKQRGKSVFVISHDQEYYGAADRIITLHYGKVSGDGRLNVAVTG